MKKMILPNNLELFYLGQEETEFIYKEIFIDKEYLKHGITINDEDCILDVGANIGLFSIFLNTLQKQFKIFAFEPVKPIFEVLTANVNLHSVSNISLYNHGLGSENISEKTFTFYPNMAGNSTSKPWEKVNQRAVMNTVLHQDMVDYFFQSQEVKCEIKTLSSVINSLDIKTIHLLKIDVEGEEYEVLSGINQTDWHKIQQIVLEVQDTEGRINKIQTLLENQGFRIILDPNNMIPSAFKMFNIYAIRA
ncbi:FkbM family methyltransferase [Anabaena sp. UHCC 0204]|uniref:FkbM family methyltransferase n=1 Tax=Anabaena sp. UHCC 0204 TaxID=2590009 RepID=UPI001444E1BD|nr:FkbM family methyltransferase [Anabaena sp. UHCC 0204]MTJ07256.1 FkbM family methyltransferase [Anabaena sp. UHCC 0204]